MGGDGSGGLRERRCVRRVVVGGQGCKLTVGLDVCAGQNDGVRCREVDVDTVVEGKFWRVGDADLTRRGGAGTGSYEDDRGRGGIRDEGTDDAGGTCGKRGAATAALRVGPSGEQNFVDGEQRRAIVRKSERGAKAGGDGGGRRCEGDGAGGAYGREARQRRDDDGVGTVIANDKGSLAGAEAGVGEGSRNIF